MFKAYSDVVFALPFSPDCKHLASESDDKTAKLW
jgi:WD40 repeat protein